MKDLNRLTDEKALPFMAHDCYGPDGPGLVPADARFRHVYKGFGG
ncbi:hypothetical protein [Iodidimonas nitroreducens]|nr:hypothetical protein [Iodidimonas nitroreducens]